MIRVRSLVSTCARECVRSATAAATVSSATRRGGSRASVAVRTLSESSFPAAEPQPPSSDTSGQGHPEGLATIHAGNQQCREDQGDTLGELLRQHTWERKDWTSCVEMSDEDRDRLTREILRRIQSLSRADKRTKASLAIRALDHGRERGVRDLIVYGEVLKQLLTIFRVSDDGPKSLEMVLQRMKDDGLEPDLKTYNLILDFHAQCHNEKDAVIVYEEMLARGFEPDAKSLSHMIVAHSRGDHDAMFRIVDLMEAKGWKGSRAAYLGMIFVMATRQDNEGVLKTIRRMRNESKRPTEAAFFWAFRAANRLKEVETAREFFQHRMDIGLPPQEYVYVKMMLMLMKDGNPEECLEYWRQLVCVQGLNGVDISLETYNFAVKCTMALGNLDEMEAVVDMMQMQGVEPTHDTYVSALSALEGGTVDVQEGMRGVERAFKAIAGIGPQPSTDLLQRKAAWYAHARMWQESVDLFGTVLSDGAKLSPRDWKCLIMSQFELGMFAEVKETWTLSTKMRKTGLSYVAIEYALRAARELGDADWALQLRAASGNQLGGGFAFVDSLVLQVLLEAERLGDARTILKGREMLGRREPSRPESQEMYRRALEFCEKSGNAEVALDFFDGMRSANPPYLPSPSCPSFAFVLKALKEAGRGDEIKPFFDDFCRRLSPNEARPSRDCYTFVAETCNGLTNSPAEEVASSASSFAQEAGPRVDGDDEANGRPREET